MKESQEFGAAESAEIQEELNEQPEEQVEQKEHSVSPEDEKKQDKEREEEVRSELYQIEEQQTVLSEQKIQAIEALESVVDNIQEKKIPIEKRIENNTHFKKTFPFLAMVDWFNIGRLTAKTMYPEEYELVESKEDADVNTLERLNTREVEAKAQIASLEANTGKPTTADEVQELEALLKTVTEFLREINTANDEEVKIEEEAMEPLEEVKERTKAKKTKTSSQDGKTT